MLRLTWVTKRGELKGARFDAVTAESHDAVMAITSHPVEEGADVADHARLEPKTLSIEGYVSNKPLLSNPDVEKNWAFQNVTLNLPKSPAGASVFTPGGLTQAAVGAIGSLLGAKKAVDQAYVLKANGAPPDRARLMFELLAQAQEDKARITVVSTSVQTITNMLIARLGVPRTLADGNGLTFQVDLQRVRIVSSERVDARPIEARGAALANKGSQAVKAADAKKEVKAKSVLANLGDSAVSAADALGL